METVVSWRTDVEGLPQIKVKRLSDGYSVITPIGDGFGAYQAAEEAARKWLEELPRR
jgi:hypothetical protein